MILEHYSRDRVYEICSTDLALQDIDMKPRGFWLSVAGEDDWPSWCRAEDFAIAKLAFRHVITLADTSNILYLDSVRAIDDFNDQYAAPIYAGGGANWIDWRLVCKEYDGIIISPYQWSRRRDGNAPWYYSWDCASGCIWNANTIVSIAIAEEKAFAE